MKQFCILTGLILGLTYSANARLGETPGTIENRYGKPSNEIWMQTPRDKKQMMALDKTDYLKSAYYHANGYSIKVEYDKGRSTKETFSKPDGIDEQDVEMLLKANGKNWALVSDTNGDKRWNSDDATANLTGSNSNKSTHHMLTFTVRPKGF